MKMSSAEIRRRFVEFFEARGHKEVPSSSLVPHNDPTVLLTTAGMQQMTPYFLGIEPPPAPRMVSVQKCFRTVDIDEVGDESHCTFFFMLGNFSVGDYFKLDAISWSWEFLTQVMGLPAERFLPSVHPDDEASFAIWRDVVGIPADRIQVAGRNNRWLDPQDNWWGPVGATGPNGPDTEIYFDRGPEHGCGKPDCAPGCGCERYLELWNNVFMEFFQDADGSRNPLPRKNVDTGMGFERLTMLMQDVRSIYDTDLYQPIIREAATLAGVAYGDDPTADRALRVIADHSRGATFLISDGVLPGNEGRSYVLRRVLRRAIRHGRLLGLDKPFLAQMAAVVIGQFAANYPELRENQRQIEKVLTHEEETFGRTLNAGMGRFQNLVAGLKTRGESLVPGEDVFRLYDTYGFPYDLTLELAQEEGMAVDREGFETAMAAQREKSRGTTAFADADREKAEFYVSLATGPTRFLGYDQLEAPATILALIGPAGPIEEVDAGQPVEVILDQTPFYAEAGGQVGDTGTIQTETGVIRVEDTRKPAPDVYVHRGRVEQGFARTGDQVIADVDAARRAAIRRNHTATHLLHRALRIVLGPETHQAGSLVAPDRLRFDFTSLEPVGPEQLRRVAEIVNREIMADVPVATETKPYREAVAGGAMALFGEKYGDVVRVVSVPDFSQELCGGTHVARTGEIGPFLITAEGSVAAGVRRIEALTGGAAIDLMLNQDRVLDDLGRELRVPWPDVPGQLAAMQDRAREQEREIARLRGQLAGARVGEILERAVSVDGTRVLAARVETESRSGLRQLGDRLRDRVNSGVIVLGSVIDGRPSLLSLVTPDLVKRGVRAGDLVRETAAIIEGRGGGRPDMAEAGGKNPERLDEALAAVPGIVKRELSG